MSLGSSNGTTATSERCWRCWQHQSTSSSGSGCSRPHPAHCATAGVPSSLSRLALVSSKPAAQRMADARPGLLDGTESSMHGSALSSAQPGSLLTGEQGKGGRPPADVVASSSQDQACLLLR